MFPFICRDFARGLGGSVRGPKISNRVLWSRRLSLGLHERHVSPHPYTLGYKGVLSFGFSGSGVGPVEESRRLWAGPDLPLSIDELGCESTDDVESKGGGARLGAEARPNVDHGACVDVPPHGPGVDVVLCHGACVCARAHGA